MTMAIRRLGQPSFCHIILCRIGLGPIPFLAMVIPTGAGANATTKGIQRTPASVAPLPDLLRDPGDDDEADGP